MFKDPLNQLGRADLRGRIFQRPAPTYEKRVSGIAGPIAKFCFAAMENSGRNAATHNLFSGSLMTNTQITGATHWSNSGHSFLPLQT